MISLPRMVKQADEGQFERMLDDVLRNGRPLSLAVRMKLQAPGSLAPAALALALQRVTELTYRPSDTAVGLLRMLLDRQAPDGSFGAVASTAAALAATHALLAQVEALPGKGSGRYLDLELHAQARAGAEAALHYLAQSQSGGLSARNDLAANAPEAECEAEVGGLIGDDLDSAIVLWQLAFDVRFTRAIRYDALLNAIEERGLRHNRVTGALLQTLDLAHASGHARAPQAPRSDRHRSAAVAA